MTQKQIILNVLKEAGVWIKSYDLQKIQTNHGWLGTSADRQARQMAEKGLIDRRQDGKYASFRYKAPRAFGEQKTSLEERRKKKFQEDQKSLQDDGQGSLL